MLFKVSDKLIVNLDHIETIEAVPGHPNQIQVTFVSGYTLNVYDVDAVKLIEEISKPTFAFFR